MSKLGVVIQKTADQNTQVSEFLRQARPSLVKLVDNLTLAPFVRQHVPQAVIIGRINSPQDTTKDPTVAAQSWVKAQRAAYEAHPEVDYWEGYQKVRTDTAQHVTWFATMESKRVALLAELGFKACIGNFATGTPELDHRWEAFLPAVDVALEHQGILGLQEFSAPFLQFAFGHHQANPQSDQGDEGWLTGRYRKVWRQFLQSSGMEIPLAITAAGIDGNALADVPWRPGHWIKGGWRAFGDWWQHEGLAPDGADAYYLQQCAWYDHELGQDEYLLGATLFAVDGQDSDFDLSGPFLDLLAKHIVNTRHAPILDEQPADLIAWSTDEKHKARYVLYAQKMHPNALQATWQYLVAYQVSYGQSFHDAVRVCRDAGDVITVINPSAAQIAWLKGHTHANLDVIQCKDLKQLAQIMKQRVSDNARFGPPWSVGVNELRLKWPVSHPNHTIIQAFGATSDYYQSETPGDQPLHGHEGWDILAAEGSEVIAAADGTVLRLQKNPDNWPYGLAVRLEHRLPNGDTYQTFYGHLGEIVCEEGDQVEARQVLGTIGQTGQRNLPEAFYLHFHLQWIGATQRGHRDPWGRVWPRNFIWPGEKMIDAYDYCPGAEPPPAGAIHAYTGPNWLARKALIGAQAPAHRRLTVTDLQTWQHAQVEAVRFQSSAHARDVDELRRQLDDPFILVQLRADLDLKGLSPAAFVQKVQTDMHPFYERGVRFFEIHHQPNRVEHGFGPSWKSGAQFASWWMAVRDLLAPYFPDASWGFPGLACDAHLHGGQEMWAFLRQAQAAVDLADWIAVHLPWDTVTQRNDHIINTLGTYRQRWPQQLLIVSEFGNFEQLENRTMPIVEFYRIVRKIHGLAAAFVCETDPSLRLWVQENRPSKLAGALNTRVF